MSGVAERQTATIFDDWFDDVQVGVVHRTPRYRFSAEDVRTFADVTGDHHPMHLDPEYGARSIFGRNVVHGMLVTSRGLGAVPLNPGRTLVLRRAEHTFKRPVLVDQEFFLDCWIASKKPADDNLGLVKVQYKIKTIPLEGGDESQATLAVRGWVEGLWARTPAAFGELSLELVGA